MSEHRKTIEEHCLLNAQGLVVGRKLLITAIAVRSGVQACLEVDMPVMMLPEDIWWKFTNVTGEREIGQSANPFAAGMTIPSGNAYEFLHYCRRYVSTLIVHRYDGDLTISIYPGLEIRIPNHELVVPEIRLNDAGQETFVDEPQAEVLIWSLQVDNENDIPRFGKPHL